MTIWPATITISTSPPCATCRERLVVELYTGWAYSIAPGLPRTSTMNAALLPEFLLGIDPPGEPQLPLASKGVQRYVWEGRFGAMLIEVKGGVVFVNGQRVEPHVAAVHPGK